MHPQQLKKKVSWPISSRLTNRTSTRSTSYLKTRIRGSRLANAARILALIELTQRLHQAYAQAYDKQASDRLLPQNTGGGEQLSSCLRDALRQYFPQQVAQGKSYSPIDDSRFKNWIPTWVKAGVAITPGAVNPAAITLGLFDINYDPKAVSITGGNVNSLETVIEEVSHTVQFLQVWAGLKPNPWAAAKIGNDFTDYNAAQDAWQSHYAYYAIKGLGYDNDVERWAKANVQRIMSDLRLHAAPNQGQICGFDLYPRSK